MATVDKSTNLAEDKERLRDEWLARLSDLVETIRGWVEELDWSTRRIETKMEDSEIGDYKAPALIIQKETVRAILQPIGRSAPDVAGVVDFYIMPAYDDIARLTFYDDAWHLRHMFSGSPDIGPRRRDQPLSRETFQAVLEAMMRMPHDLYIWMEKIKSIERDYLSTRLALDRLLHEARRDPTILTGNLEPQDIVKASGRLETTYLIRVFAEFETGLRLCWATIRETEPPTQHLLDGIAARCDIPPGRLAGAHAVREYRNSLVHERDEEMAPISIAEARGHLCRFFAFMPPTW